MICPYCKKGSHIIKTGKRRTSKGPVQKYRCMKCGRSFSDSAFPYSKYPLKLILHSMELYNMGYSATEIKGILAKRYHRSPPATTIYSWTKRFKKDLTFIKIRNRVKPDPERITKTKNFHHRQVFPFSYHIPKVNIHSKKFPGIKRYINWVERSLPDRMFLEGPRMSTYKTSDSLKPKKISNISPRLTQLALERASHPNSPHTSVENFFLVNDSSTVATEIPVFLNPGEIKQVNIHVPITGHIDILQARFDHIYVMDYKPDLNHPENHSTQLRLYGEAISKRMNIEKEKISLMAFNEHSVFEYR